VVAALYHRPCSDAHRRQILRREPILLKKSAVARDDVR
jgi:hypothetical protein